MPGDSGASTFNLRVLSKPNRKSKDLTVEENCSMVSVVQCPARGQGRLRGTPDAHLGCLLIYDSVLDRGASDSFLPVPFVQGLEVHKSTLYVKAVESVARYGLRTDPGKQCFLHSERHDGTWGFPKRSLKGGSILFGGMKGYPSFGQNPRVQRRQLSELASWSCSTRLVAARDWDAASRHQPWL